jgi:pilus assembly protein CpaB
MNRTRLLMIGVLALALGLFASVYVFRTLQSKSGNHAESMIDVIVAANDLPVGAKIGPSDIKIISIPATDLPERAPRRKADVLDHGVILPIGKGDFILPSKLAGDNAGAGLPSLIPPGMRAVSVRVNDVVSLAGFVTPGTRVDVLMTGTPTGSEQQTTTVLQNIAVLAAGHTLERSATGEPTNTPVITLLVSPDDAQRLTLASAEGHIQLSMRSPLDTRAEEVPSVGARGLYKGVSAPVSAAVAHHTVVVKKPAPIAAPPPTGMSIEVYQGDKKPDVVKCTDNGCEASK